MVHLVKCPGCGCLLQMSEGAAGGEIRCANCGDTLQVARVAQETNLGPSANVRNALLSSSDGLPPVLAEIVSPPAPARGYGNVNRAVFLTLYVFLQLGALAVFFVWIEYSQSLAMRSLAGPVLAVIQISLMLTLTALRFKNIGTSPLWALVLFVPVFNLIVLLACLVCPQGYAQTRKLDVAGKGVLGVLLFLLFAGIILIIASLPS